MTKRELVIQVAEKLGMTQHEVANVVQSMFDTVTETLVDGNRLEIRNFGVFEVKKRDARVGRNPRTGDEVPIPQKSVAFFKPGKVLKKIVQDGTVVTASQEEPGGDVSPSAPLETKPSPPEAQNETEQHDLF